MSDIDVSHLPDPKDLARRHKYTLLDNIDMLGVLFVKKASRDDGMIARADVGHPERRDTAVVFGDHGYPIMRDVIVSTVAATAFARMTRSMCPSLTMWTPTPEIIEQAATSDDASFCWIRDYTLEVLVPTVDLYNLAAEGLDADQIAERLGVPESEVILHARLLNITLNGES